MFIDGLSALFLLIGLSLFGLAIFGLFTLPDFYSRIHALTKADNVALGFIVLGCTLQSSSVWHVVVMFAIWGFVVFASAVCGTLLARLVEEAKLEALNEANERVKEG